MTREVLVLLLAILQLGVESTSGDRCLQCNDFNRQREGQCVISSHKECGDCKHGFIEDAADPRYCYELELISISPNVTVEAGTSIHLPCKFSVPVYCYWMRNGSDLTIGGPSRYQYASTTHVDNQRHDCSLNITNVSNHDAGQWTCGSLGTSERESFQSELFLISVTTRQNTTTVNLKPEMNVTATTTATGNGYQASNIPEAIQLSLFMNTTPYVNMSHVDDAKVNNASTANLYRTSNISESTQLRSFANNTHGVISLMYCYFFSVLIMTLW